jgi:hypothetical protein
VSISKTTLRVDSEKAIHQNSAARDESILARRRYCRASTNMPAFGVGRDTLSLNMQHL